MCSSSFPLASFALLATASAKSKEPQEDEPRIEIFDDSDVFVLVSAVTNTSTYSPGVDIYLKVTSTGPSVKKTNVMNAARTGSGTNYNFPVIACVGGSEDDVGFATANDDECDRVSENYNVEVFFGSVVGCS